MAKKKLKDYGYDSLDALSDTMKEIRAGKSDPVKTLETARVGNTIARNMDSTLRVEKFGFAVSSMK